MDAATGGQAGPSGEPIRLDRAAIRRAARDWATRFLVAGTPFFPICTIVFAWMFRDHTNRILLASWTVASLAIAALNYSVSRKYLTERANGGDFHRWELRQPVGLAAIALIWGAAPFLLHRTDANTSARVAAMFFPMAVSVLIAVMTAPVRRLFAIGMPFLFTPSMLWLVFNHDVVLKRLSFAAAGFGVLLVMLFRTVHGMMTTTVELGLSNQLLVEELQSDRLEMHRVNDRLAQANDRLSEQATHDSLTGLRNRRGLLEQLDRDLARAQSTGQQIIVLFCDLDRFKVINDSLGHGAGDHLLAIVSARLSAAFAPPHLLARLGGDEFVVVCAPEGVQDVVATARQYGDQVRSTIGSVVEIEGHQLVVTASVGVAIGPMHGSSSRDLLRHADAALLQAKDAGRDRYEIFDDSFRVSLSQRVDEEQSIRRALDDGEFVPWYQPIVDARSGDIIGAELLVRWQNGLGPPRPAAAFIDLVSESGLVERMSECVIEKGLSDLARWEADGLPDAFRLSVNLPPRYMSRTGRVHRIAAMLKTGPCHRLTVEVTESSLVDDLDYAERVLSDLRSLGMTVALDDFGTGSASLTLLQRLPLDCVKIDRSFVSNMATDERDRALVRGFISLAHDLRLSVTAEGIESAVQRQLLLQLGCSSQQGYLHGAAMDSDAFGAMIADRRLVGARRSA